MRYHGNPADLHDGVIVVRDDAVIASIGFARFSGEWSSPGGTICSGTGVHLREG